MPIKSEVSKPSPKAAIGYPKLKSTELGTIALFTDATTAIVIKEAPLSMCKIGDEAAYPHSPCWSDFDGTVTLSNERSEP